jgi:hypothetical protein
LRLHVPPSLLLSSYWSVLGQVVPAVQRIEVGTGGPGGELLFPVGNHLLVANWTSVEHRCVFVSTAVLRWALGAGSTGKQKQLGWSFAPC